MAIVGCHSSGRDAAIPDDYEVWVVNDGWKVYDRYDRLYDLHRLEERPWRSEEHIERLHASDGRVWTILPDRIEGAKVLPVQELLTKYPPYFTNSPAWMVAHALHEGATHIALIGLHFATPKERLLERPCIEFWIGYAKGLGVEVTVPAATPLLKGRGLYGLEDSLHNVATECDDWAWAWAYERERDVLRFARSGFYEEAEPAEPPGGV